MGGIAQAEQSGARRSEHRTAAGRAEQSGQADQSRDQRQRERNGNLSTGAEHRAVSGVAPPGRAGRCADLLIEPQSDGEPG